MAGSITSRGVQQELECMHWLLASSAWTHQCCWVFCAWHHGSLTVGTWLLHHFFESHMNPSMCTSLWVSKCNVWGFFALLLGSAGGWFFSQKGDALSLYSCRCGLAFRYSRHFPAKLGTGTKLYVQGLYHRDHVGNNPHLPCGKS